MSRKQMEGDNPRRRSLGRQARNRGQGPGEARATLGASKQLAHLAEARREGPPAAGPHKPVPGAIAQAIAPEHGHPPGEPPTWDSDVVGGPAIVPGRVSYRELVAEVGRRTGLDTDGARIAAIAAVTALADALTEPDRERLLDSLPAPLHDDTAPAAHPSDLPEFLDVVAYLSHRDRAQARYQAQAALSALADQDRDLVESLHIPDDIRELLAPPPAGGVVDQTGRPARLTDEEVRGALADLPQWSGDQRALTRLLVLPPDNLERVLARVARLRIEVGRSPHVGRRGHNQAVLVVRSTRSDGVTAQDVDLAYAVDAAIDEAGAGVAS
jgi:pterin-4a-carbinolamine dehydratase